MNKEKTKKSCEWEAVCHAFTLAEVIITIGIIGVVAALIVPNLVQALQEKGMTTSALVFERKLEESLRVMNTADELGGYETTEDFVNGLSKHMKISKTCDNNNLNKCFKENFVDAEKKAVRLDELKTSKQMAVSDYGTETIGVMFANGVSALLAYDKNCEGNPYDNNSPVMSCVSLIYDVNGNGRPNKISSDVRLLNASLVDVDGSDAVIAKINGVKITKIADSKVYGYVNCTDTESEDYKNYCEESTEYSADFWAGAVKYCGGKDKMASDEDLAKIAQYIYNDNSISSTGTYSDLTLDTSKALELQGYGFPDVNSSNFKVWSSNNNSSNYISAAWLFDAHTMNRLGHYRNNVSPIAVCVKH